MLVKWAYNTFFVLGILAMLIIANLSLLLSVFGPTPLEYKNLPFPTDKHTYNEQESLTMFVTQCSRESTPVAAVSVKEFYNPATGGVVSLSPGSRIIPPGCSRTDVTFGMLFPPDLQDGTYTLRGVTTFRGSLGTVDVAWQTVSFDYKKRVVNEQ